MSEAVKEFSGIGDSAIDYSAIEYSAIVPVPKEARHYGFWDMVATWIGANACTSSWYTGGVLAAVGIGGAFAVIFIANPIAYVIMALVGYMGYKIGTTTMGLTGQHLVFAVLYCLPL